MSQTEECVVESSQDVVYERMVFDGLAKNHHLFKVSSIPGAKLERHKNKMFKALVRAKHERGELGGRVWFDKVLVTFGKDLNQLVPDPLFFVKIYVYTGQAKQSKLRTQQVYELFADICEKWRYGVRLININEGNPFTFGNSIFHFWFLKKIDVALVENRHFTYNQSFNRLFQYSFGGELC